MERKQRARTESAVFVAVIAAALVLVNLIGLRFFARWDLTERQLFTLSQGTRRIVGQLSDQLTITVYFTPNQPPPANDDERFLRDQLDEYRSVGRGRINVRYVTPDNDDRKHQADSAGCVKRPLQAVNQREEQATIIEAYRCVTFEYLGRRERIEFLPPGVQGLEYEISASIRNISLREGERERTIGFLTGHGEQGPDEGMQYLSQILEQARVNYRTRAINLNNGENAVPSDIKGLIIVNPTRRIEERELRQLDAYLMRGGSVALFAGGLNFASTDPTNATGTASEHHLNEWLDNYGIHVNTDVVLDPRSSDGVIRYQGGMGRVRLYTWPMVMAVEGRPTQRDLLTQGGLDPEFPAAFRMPEFITPYPSTLTINDANVRRGGGTLRIFARSGPRSVARTSDFDMNIIEINQHRDEIFRNPRSHGPYVLGAAIEGRFRSAYAGRPATAAAGSPAATPVPERAERPARIMVVGSGSMFAMDTLRIMAQLGGGRLPVNLNLLFNTFDWLSQDLDLLAVRAKDTSDPTLRSDVSDTARSIFKWGSIVVLPIGIGAIGVAVTGARRSRRRNFARDYAPGEGSGASKKSK